MATGFAGSLHFPVLFAEVKNKKIIGVYSALLISLA
jgi:hypothetical protein